MAENTGKSMRYTWDDEYGLFRREDGKTISYSDGRDVEYRLGSIIRAASDRGTYSAELARQIRDWPSEYHLSRWRHCLLRPLNIKAGERVLEIGCGCGALTRYLGEIGAVTVALEGSLVRARIAAARCNDLQNVKVYADNLLDSEIAGSFDWILMVGVLEYAPVYVRSEQPLIEYLERAFQYRATTGKLVVAIENKLGLKYWNGCSEDHLGTPYLGIEGLYDPGQPITLGRKELIDLLKSAGLSIQDFYYPFPDYKLPSVVLTESGVASPDLCVGDLLARAHARDYTGLRFRNFDDALVLDQVARNGLLAELSNSFLVVAGSKSVVQDEEPMLAMAFSADRIPEFATVTTIRRVDGDMRVSKEAMFPNLQRIAILRSGLTLTNVTGESRYIFGRQLLWSILRARAKSGPLPLPLAEVFMPWFEYLLGFASLLGSASDSGPSNRLADLVLPSRFIDCTPFNLIEANGTLHLIDNEWTADGSVALGWIVTRGVMYCLLAGVPSAGWSRPLDETVQELCAKVGLIVTKEEVQDWASEEADFQSVLTGRQFPPLSVEMSSSGLRRIRDEVEYLSDRTRSYQEEIPRMQHHFEEEVARMQQRSETERRGMLSELQEAHVNLSALRTGTHELSDALQRARRDVVDVQSESAARLTEASARLDYVEEQFEKLITSRSWRVTQPLRSFVEKVRAVRRRPSEGVSQAETNASSAEESAPAFNVTAGKEEWDRHGTSRIADLLRSERRIVFPPVGQSRPDVSIIVVLFNKSHLSLLCLESILANSDVKFEVVIVDNNSTDETQQLIDRLDGATVIRNERNAGFGPACMQGAAIARGEYLCFLNNDALLEPGCLSAAVRDLRDDLTVGAVGGKILFADGRLQEAGSIIWNDGSALGYGRGDDPRLPRYEFRRPVDYCSAALLFTPAQLFRRLGGFSAEFSPAYYEDTDYCTAVWASGRRVIYEPLAVIRHYESASSGDNEAARPRMAENQRKFREKWRNVLSLHSAPAAENVHRARIATSSKALRIVYMDDRVPHRNLGSGFPRSNDIVNHLAGRGHQVVCLSLSYSLDGGGHMDIARDVECVDASGDSAQVCREHVQDADIVWVSRPHNMERLLQWLVTGEIRAGCRLVYDAEAIFACRDKIKAAVLGWETSGAVMDSWLSRELDLARAADTVVCVSQRDSATIAGCGLPNVHIVGHQLGLSPTPTDFKERRRFLFVGAMHGRDNPNADSMRYFCNEVWPIVQASTGTELLIAGYGTDGIREELVGRGIHVVGPRDDLFPLYNEARVFVVPTRYAAGIPFKAHEAAAHGVPLVVSQMIGEQLGWHNESECLIAVGPTQFADACCRLYEEEELWSRIRAAALRRVEQDLSEAQFGDSIDQVIETVKCRKG